MENNIKDEGEAEEEEAEAEEAISSASPLNANPIFTISSPMSNSTSLNYPSPFEPPPDYDSWSAVNTPSTTCSYCSSSAMNAQANYSINRRSCCYYYPGPPPQGRWDVIPENIPREFHAYSQRGVDDNRRWMRVSKNSFIIKRWALILLILVMLIMVSLLFGITLQHVQLLRSVAHLHSDEDSRSLTHHSSRGLGPIINNSPTESSVLKHRPIHHSMGKNTYSEKDW